MTCDGTPQLLKVSHKACTTFEVDAKDDNSFERPFTERGKDPFAGRMISFGLRRHVLSTDAGNASGVVQAESVGC